jgi:anthranilate phosphoribosyltransferase
VTIDDPDAIDVCGTGGDGAGTFNISTVAAFVVAGAGVTVAKHGNRSISSSCGSADVLRALGINIELSPQKAAESINTIGIGFLFAPLFHPAMKRAAKPRAELGVKTAFNLLGPMTNPAGVRRQLVGAFSREAAMKMAAVFSCLSSKKVYVVTSHDGLDEVSPDAATLVCEVERTTTTQYELAAAEFGFPSNGGVKSIKGGSANLNASITTSVLEGVRNSHRNYVIANAALGLMAAGKAKSISEGVLLAEESIDSGRALEKLNRLREFNNR